MHNNVFLSMHCKSIMVFLFIVIRSQRLSTDTTSDSGSSSSSSGVSSDSNVEEGLPDSTATTPVALM